MSTPIQITIIEDNKAFRTTLQAIIQVSETMHCVAAFPCAESCSDALIKGDLSGTNLIILDLHLPGKDGLMLVPLFQQHLPMAEILVITQNSDYLSTLEAIQLGVEGYILKTASVPEIRSAITEVHNGGSVIDPQLSRLVLRALSANAAPNNEPLLSQREQQVLELIAMGYVKKEVADRLDLSYHTVAKYTERIFAKLQVPTIAAAVAAAIRKGLI